MVSGRASRFECPVWPPSYSSSSLMLLGRHLLGNRFFRRHRMDCDLRRRPRSLWSVRSIMHAFSRSHWAQFMFWKLSWGNNIIKLSRWSRYRGVLRAEESLLITHRFTIRPNTTLSAGASAMSLIGTGLPKNCNFIIFEFSRNILSRGPSVHSPLPTKQPRTEIDQAM